MHKQNIDYLFHEGAQKKKKSSRKTEKNESID